MRNLMILIIYSSILSNSYAALKSDKFLRICKKIFAKAPVLQPKFENYIKVDLNKEDEHYTVTRRAYQNIGIGVIDTIFLDVLGFHPALKKIADLYQVKGIEKEIVKTNKDGEYVDFTYKLPNFEHFIDIMMEQRKIYQQTTGKDGVPCLFDFYPVTAVVNNIVYLERFLKNELPIGDDSKWFAHDYVLHSFNNQLFEGRFFIPIKSIVSTFLSLRETTINLKKEYAPKKWKSLGGPTLEQILLKWEDELSSKVDTYTFYPLRPFTYNYKSQVLLIKALKEEFHKSLHFKPSYVQNPTTLTTNGQDLLNSIFQLSKRGKFSSILADEVTKRTRYLLTSDILFEIRLNENVENNIFENMKNKLFLFD
ncbi:MAG: hypothetical protein H6622_09605 [Halobacteriovoraceae bacterium]|nr:hypothetical protein [Halobacteriovoraceae bacterium]